MKRLKMLKLCLNSGLSVTSKFLLQAQMQTVTQPKREFITDLLELFFAKAPYIEPMLL